MPRKPRIEIPGYYHIINRGVEQRVIFEEVIIFEKVTEVKERNETIAKAYLQGYSQNMIAKVLGLNQATVQRIIKRT
ncbi:MAG: helix-turn-helix domain-containing protein [Campylobacterota bacterium]|nr:helix-turn-helix domain-containing protein [Campylobacterota bacterium]